MANNYSKKRVSKAGKELIVGDARKNREKYYENLEVLSYWRACHEVALDNAFKTLTAITLKKDKNAFFSKRLKRHVSIVEKLKRFPRMELKNMQDIGGCRAVVSSPKKVIQVARDFKNMPEFKNNDGTIRFKDYIKEPKEDGYRGYHLIGKFDDGYGDKKSIELQIRTKLQHDWATTLEIVDLFTGQALKSNQGEESWKIFFTNTSIQFSIMEESGHFHTLELNDKYEAYGKQLLRDYDDKKLRLESCLLVKEQSKKLGITNLLAAYASSLQLADEWLTENSLDGYVLLEVDTLNRKVKGSFFLKEDFDDAKQFYIEREKAAEGGADVIVLVSSNAVGGVKEAYPNYFADSAAFIDHLSLILKAPVSVKKSLRSKLSKWLMMR